MALAHQVDRRVGGLPLVFASFLGGLTISRLGDALYSFAIPWIAYDLTGSAIVMGSLFATEVLPVLLFGAFAGVYVDRWNRRTLMLAADVIRASTVSALPILHWLGWLQIWHLYVAAFLLALVSLVFDVTTTAIIPEIAGDDLTRSNALHQGATQLAGMAGPAIAGLVIAAVGGFNALWLDAFSFGGTFLVVLLMLPDLRQAAPAHTATSVLYGIREGFQWLWRQPVIRTLSLQAMVGNFGFSMVSAVLMYYLRSTLGLNAEISGLNYAMLGIGGLLGSVAIVPLNRRYRKGVLYPAIIAFGLTGLLIMATIRTWWSPGLGFGMVSACNIAWVVLSTSVRQTLIPPDLMGRVLSFSRILSLAAMPLGAMVGGFLMSRVDPSVVFLIAVLTKALEWCITHWSSMRHL